MEWTPEAENAVKKVPFFVRKRVKARVEDEARQEGKATITLSEVQATQKRFLSGMAAEVKGYQLDTCFGQSGCPHRIQDSSGLIASIETLLRKADLRTFLKTSGVTDLKFHHELRVTIAECPNACSQPQIKDIGIIGTVHPAITDEPCTGCGACEQVCKEDAVKVDQDGPKPQFDWTKCVDCGQCMAACPSGTLAAGAKGYRVYLGGRLGRHPRLAIPLPGIYTATAVLDIIKTAIELYKTRSTNGRRFAQLLTAEDLEHLAERFSPQRLDNIPYPPVDKR